MKEIILKDEEFDLYLKDFDSYMFARKLQKPMKLDQFIEIESRFFDNWIAKHRNYKTTN